jgi:transcriptional antiterminator RfaH
VPWLVGITQPNKEHWAKTNIERQGFESYLPCFRETYVWRGRVTQRDACLFPRYIFVKSEGPWLFLRNTFGMSGVVHFGTCPITMPETGIRELKSRESMGLIQLPERLASRLKPMTRYRKGQNVQVAYGPFTGYKGICMGDKAKARVWVLFRYLGGETRVLVARDALVAAA